MAPFIVQIIVTIAAKIRLKWRDAARVGIAVMFAFTSISHFAPMKADLAAMIPPPFTGELWIIYVTGVLEAAGAIGLLIPRFRRYAGMGLILLLIAMFPANVFAALNGVVLRGRPASPMWWRAPLQLFWIAVVWWSSVAPAVFAEKSVAAREQGL